MARVTYTEALEASNVDIVDKFLVIDTIQDGYFNIYKGLHPYRVIEDNGDLAVYPTHWSENDALTNGPYPIIRTIGDDVFFTKQTRNDPYNGPNIIEMKENFASKEHKILDAFNAFVQSEFTLGEPHPIHVFIADGEEIGIEDEPVEFEFRDLHGNVVEEDEGPELPEVPEDGNELGE